jgi:hypothetical protein
MAITPHQKLAGLLLAQPVDQWIRDRRAEGMSWRAVTKLLSDKTNGQIDITHETVRAWAEQKPERVA